MSDFLQDAPEYGTPWPLYKNPFAWILFLLVGWLVLKFIGSILNTVMAFGKVLG